MKISPASKTNFWYLRSVNLLEQIDRKELERLARLLSLRELSRGEVVLLSQSETERVYFLFKGKVGVSRIDAETGKEITMYIIQPGEPFGMTTGEEGEGTVARALQKSLVGYVSRREFTRLIRQAELGIHLQKLMEKRMVTLQNRIEELAFRDVRSRLASLLTRLAREFPAKCPEGEGRGVAMRATRQELANLIAASREITSSTLNDMRREGILAFHGRRICIHDPKALRELAQ